MIGLEPAGRISLPCSLSGTRPASRSAGFLAQLEKLHVRANLWFNPYVSPTAPLYAKLLPFAGSHLVWNGIVPDYTLPAARRIFSDHLQQKVVDLNPAAVVASKSTKSTAVTAIFGPMSRPSPPPGCRTAAPDLRRVAAKADLRSLPPGESAARSARCGARTPAPRRCPSSCYNDNYSFSTSTSRGRQHRVCRRALVARGAQRRSRGNGAPHASGVLFAAGALQRWMTATNSSGPTHGDRPHPRRDHAPPAPAAYWYTTFAQYHYEGTPVIRPLPLLPGFGAKAPPEAGKLDATPTPMRSAAWWK